MPPKEITVKRINATHMNVTWEKMSLVEARGFITGYTISYDVFEGRQWRAAIVEEVGPDKLYKVIGGLDPKNKYILTMSASTSAGKGVESAAIIAEGIGRETFLVIQMT